MQGLWETRGAIVQLGGRGVFEGGRERKGNFASIVRGEGEVEGGGSLITTMFEGGILVLIVTGGERGEWVTTL